MIMRCPGCDRETGLYDHAVKDDGNVEPSCDCPHGDCSFHEWVKLEDWPESADADERPQSSDLGGD